MTATLTPRDHAQASALRVPCVRGWIPCEASVPLGTPVTIQQGPSRRTVYVIASKNGAIMLDYP